MLKTLGKENAIIIGLLFMMLQQLILSSLIKVESQQWFLQLSFTQAIVGSLAHGVMAVSYRAIVISDSRRRREINIGMLEASIGLGYLAGPLLGS